MTYVAAPDRYDRMIYNRCGRSGLKLPAVSLGLWHNFGHDRPIDTSRAIGRLMHDDLRPYRDELVISTKAGYDMWPGPYGEWGSRKYLLASLDQSLQRRSEEHTSE